MPAASGGQGQRRARRGADQGDGVTRGNHRARRVLSMPTLHELQPPVAQIGLSALSAGIARAALFAGNICESCTSPARTVGRPARVPIKVTYITNKRQVSDSLRSAVMWPRCRAADRRASLATRVTLLVVDVLVTHPRNRVSSAAVGAVAGPRLVTDSAAAAFAARAASASSAPPARAAMKVPV